MPRLSGDGAAPRFCHDSGPETAGVRERTSQVRNTLAYAAAGVLVTAMLTGCADAGAADDGGDQGDARVGVILPDTTSSDRWRNSEPKFFKAAFAAAGIPVEIRNAGGDPDEFRRIGNAMIDGGVQVLIIVNVDSASGKAVLDRAAAERIPTIDYDRLTLNGAADYYVGFDNDQIGELLGYGLTRCIRDKKVRNPTVASLNGAPGDSNATFAKVGYDRILQTQFDEGGYIKGPDQFVPGWDGKQARQVFDQMVRQQPRINAVLAASDELAAAVIEALRAKGLNGKVPVTGQDATVAGLRNVLSGDQCMTIYKKIESEAYTAANLAKKLFHGEKPVIGAWIKDPESGAEVPFAGLPPLSIDATTVKDVVADGFVSRKALCTGRYAALCKRYGVK
jgi:D-xylose transport system substrate-binding protein